MKLAFPPPTYGRIREYRLLDPDAGACTAANEIVITPDDLARFWP